MMLKAKHSTRRDMSRNQTIPTIQDAYIQDTFIQDTFIQAIHTTIQEAFIQFQENHTSYNANMN